VVVWSVNNGLLVGQSKRTESGGIRSIWSLGAGVATAATWTMTELTVLLNSIVTAFDG
jgi:hypothetical protein